MPEPGNGPPDGTPDLAPDASPEVSGGAPPEVPAVVRRYLDEHIEEAFRNKLDVLTPARANPVLPIVLSAAIALGLALAVLLPRTGRLNEDAVAAANELSALSSGLERIQEELAATQGRLTELEQARSQASAALEELTAGATEVERMRTDLTELRAQLGEVAETRAQLADLDRRLTEVSVALERLVEDGAEATQGTALDEPGPAVTPPAEGTEATTEAIEVEPNQASVDEPPATSPSADGWRSLALESGWKPLSSGDAPPEYRIDDSGALELRGRVEATTDTSPQRSVLRLPPGCRPAGVEVFQTDADDGRRAATARVTIDVQGDLMLESMLEGSDLRRGGWIALEGIRIEPSNARACRP